MKDIRKKTKDDQIMQWGISNVSQQVNDDRICQAYKWAVHIYFLIISFDHHRSFVFNQKDEYEDSSVIVRCHVHTFQFYYNV